MNRLFTILLLGTSIPALAATYTVSAGSSSSTIQETLNAAAQGSTVLFSPGNYDITTQITVPCISNLTVTGPVATPATAVLSSTYPRSFIMALTRCSTPVTIAYLGFNGNQPSGGGGGGIYVPGNTNNFTITHNTLHGNQGVRGSGGEVAMSLIWLDGTSPGTTDSNIAVTWNQLGATGDCSNIMSIMSDQGAYCEGLGIHTNVDGGTFSDNTVYHQEEGIKVWSGSTGRNCASCVFENNDFSNIHRIAFESQSNPVPAMTVQFNSYHDAFVPFYYTFGLSSANGVAAITNTDDNVIVANVAPVPGEYIAMGIEVWGSGSTANDNLVEGYWANGFQYNYLGNFTISNNLICGPGTPGKGMEYISVGNPVRFKPTETGNITTATCSAITSTAPTISQSDADVTLSDAGINHSIYYTTDGSTPTTASTLYTTPFTADSGAMIQAIGMWGQGGNPKSYPPGYGYVPSAVVSAVYTGVTGPAVPSTSTLTLVSAYLGSAGSANTMVLGHTLQFKAYGTYSDGSVATMPDSQGDAVTAWNTSNHSVATISSGGQVTALGIGTVNIMATIGNLRASVWTVKVSAAPATRAFPGGTYNIGSSYVIDGGYHNAYWGNPPAAEANARNGSPVGRNPNQEFGFAASGTNFTICNLPDGACLTDGGTDVEIGQGTDSWLITASGSGWTIKNTRTGNFMGAIPSVTRGNIPVSTMPVAITLSTP